MALRRCTGQVIRLPNGKTKQLPCRRYYCPRCGERRASYDTNTILRGGFNRLVAQYGLVPSDVFIVRFSLPKEQLTFTELDLGRLKQRVSRLLKNITSFGLREGVIVHNYAIYVVGVLNQTVHVHMALTWLPAPTRTAGGVWSDNYLSAKCLEYGLLCHFEPIRTNFDAIVGYFYQNLVESLKYDYPPNFRRVTYSKVFKPAPREPQQLPLLGSETAAGDTLAHLSIYNTSLSPSDNTEQLLTELECGVRLLTRQTESDFSPPDRQPTANSQQSSHVNRADGEQVNRQPTERTVSNYAPRPEWINAAKNWVNSG